MSEKIKVPEAMLAAALNATIDDFPKPYEGQIIIKKALEAALLWQRENPIRPTIKQCEELQENVGIDIGTARVNALVTAWQTMMYNAPEPEPTYSYAAPYFIRDAGLKAGEGLFSSAGKPLAIWDGDGLQPWPAFKHEHEVPEEIKDLLYTQHDTSPPFERHNNLVIEAFLRGKNSKQ